MKKEAKLSKLDLLHRIDEEFKRIECASKNIKGLTIKDGVMRGMVSVLENAMMSNLKEARLIIEIESHPERLVNNYRVYGVNLSYLKRAMDEKRSLGVNDGKIVEYLPAAGVRGAELASADFLGEKCGLSAVLIKKPDNKYNLGLRLYERVFKKCCVKKKNIEFGRAAILLTNLDRKIISYPAKSATLTIENIRQDLLKDNRYALTLHEC